MAKNIIEFSIVGKNQFNKTFKAFNSGIATTARGLKTTAKWTTVATTVTTAFTKAVAATDDAQAKFATRIGQSVDELSKYQFVSKQAGLNTATFNMATQRMTRRVGEAAQGLGEAKGALHELGVDAKSFSQLGLDKQMLALSDAMQQVEDPSQRLRLGFKLFDSEGTAMLQMLNQGSAAMQAAARDAEYLGVVISKQAAANAEKFEDTTGRLTSSIKGLSRGIAHELIPLFSGLSDQLANTVADNREAIVGFVKAGVVNLFTFGNVVKQVFTNVSEIFTDVKALSIFIDNMGTTVVALGKTWMTGMKALAKIIWEGLKGVTSVVVEFGSWFIDTVQSWFSDKQAGDFSDRMSKAIVNAIADSRAAMSTELSGIGQEFKNNLADTSAAIKTTFGIDMRSATDDAKAMIESLSLFGEVASQSIGNSGARIVDIMGKVREDTQLWQDSYRTSFVTFMGTMRGAVDQTVDGISMGMARAMVQGENLAESMKQLFKDVITNIIAGLIKLGIQQAIYGAIASKAISSDLSKTMGAESAKTYARSFSAVVGTPGVGPVIAPGTAAASTAAMQAGAVASATVGAGIGAGLPGREFGGPVAGGRSYLVGESGPEVFTPKNSGNITPNAGSGGVTIQNLVIHILENATSPGALLDMNDRQMEEIVAVKIIPALNSLDNIGVTPNSIQRIERI